ncbi:nucleolar GTP-binding protein 1 [Toxoplasma gondii MAS]|uniref:Nucleolar GTP-binding protein 1 n=1 Tax=Toxoplasma gondii MAS TaxID=943118 RepID=A0A086PSL2_TOXGO|nr:nucleolar GTP-binding protein 1 [Toxoplasma gondii MAS]
MRLGRPRRMRCGLRSVTRGDSLPFLSNSVPFLSNSVPFFLSFLSACFAVFLPLTEASIASPFAPCRAHLSEFDSSSFPFPRCPPCLSHSPPCVWQSHASALPRVSSSFLSSKSASSRIDYPHRSSRSPCRPCCLPSRDRPRLFPCLLPAFLPSASLSNAARSCFPFAPSGSSFPSFTPPSSAGLSASPSVFSPARFYSSCIVSSSPGSSFLSPSFSPHLSSSFVYSSVSSSSSLSASLSSSSPSSTSSDASLGALLPRVPPLSSLLARNGPALPASFFPSAASPFGNSSPISSEGGKRKRISSLAGAGIQFYANLLSKEIRLAVQTLKRFPETVRAPPSLAAYVRAILLLVMSEERQLLSSRRERRRVKLAEQLLCMQREEAERKRRAEKEKRRKTTKENHRRKTARHGEEGEQKRERAERERFLDQQALLEREKKLVDATQSLPSVARVYRQLKALYMDLVATGKQHAAQASSSQSVAEARERYQDGLRSLRELLVMHREALLDYQLLSSFFKRHAEERCSLQRLSPTKPLAMIVGAPNVGKTSLFLALVSANSHAHEQARQRFNAAVAAGMKPRPSSSSSPSCPSSSPSSSVLSSSTAESAPAGAPGEEATDVQAPGRAQLEREAMEVGRTLALHASEEVPSPDLKVHAKEAIDVSPVAFSTQGLHVGKIFERANGTYKALGQVLDGPPLLLPAGETERNVFERLTLTTLSHLPCAVFFLFDCSSLPRAPALGEEGAASREAFAPALKVTRDADAEKQGKPLEARTETKMAKAKTGREEKSKCPMTLSEQIRLRQMLRQRFPKRPWIDVIAKADELTLYQLESAKAMLPPCLLLSTHQSADSLAQVQRHLRLALLQLKRAMEDRERLLRMRQTQEQREREVRRKAEDDMHVQTVLSRLNRRKGHKGNSANKAGDGAPARL